MNFPEARAFILERLEKELPSNLYYHGPHHTVDVCHAVEKLAAKEGVTGESLTILCTAAAFHDCGFIKQYVNNEPVAVEMVRCCLPQFGYSEKEIAVISNVILSTRIPQQPQNHIEQIMCDADLDYLGRDDFFDISHTLMKEWLTYGIVKSEQEYNEKQIRFFSEHTYFTMTAKMTRDAKKQEHLAELKRMQ